MTVAALARQPRVKPKFRGVSHAIAFCLTAVASLWLVTSHQTGAAYAGGLVYAGTVLLMFGISGSYHFFNWSVGMRRVLRRLDHSGIFLFIAGTVTAFWGLAPSNDRSPLQLWGMWAAAIIGVLLVTLWTDMPRGARAAAYVALGVSSVPQLLTLPRFMGWPPTAWVALAGVIYIAGAAVYARRWPNPNPRVFGYHEVFHVMVIIAAAIHFTIIAQRHWAT